MNALETKQAIQSALSDLASKPLADAATSLLEVLGYTSQKRLTLKPNTAANFAKSFVGNRPFNEGQAQIADWESVDFLFQLTDEEIRTQGQRLLFESQGQWDGKIIESYLFFAISLKRPTYTRTELAGIIFRQPMAGSTTNCSRTNRPANSFRDLGRRKLIWNAQGNI